MESTDDDSFYHLFKTTKEGYTRLENGVLELYDSKDEYMPMRMSFTLSPATIRVNKELVFQKNWWHTDINQQEEQAQQQTELFVSEIKWRGKKGNYTSSVYRHDMILNQSIDLKIITKDFTVKQSNARRIKGQSTEFSVNGSVDADGLATISNFKVECDFKEDNQAFRDIIEFIYNS